MIANKLTIILALACIVCTVAYAQVHVGGLADEKGPDNDVRNVIKSVQEEIHKEYEKGVQSIEPISYRTQVVSGMNYFIKALITEKDGTKSTAHLRVWKTFNGKHSLTALKTNVPANSKLEYFT